MTGKGNAETGNNKELANQYVKNIANALTKNSNPEVVKWQNELKDQILTRLQEGDNLDIFSDPQNITQVLSPEFQGKELLSPENREQLSKVVKDINKVSKNKYQSENPSNEELQSYLANKLFENLSNVIRKVKEVMIKNLFSPQNSETLPKTPSTPHADENQLQFLHQPPKLEEKKAKTAHKRPSVLQ